MLRIATAVACLLASSTIDAQIYNQYYSEIVENVSPQNILNDLVAFEDFGVKEVGTEAIDSAKNWIIDRYADLGYGSIETQQFSMYGKTTSNIIVTKIGTVYPDTFLIIDAHYDTINGPGTNDNGSGTVLLLELARLLRDVETDYSIKFIHFSGEELGLIGSQFYVDNTVIPENMDIKLVLNIDEVGGVSGTNNNTIVCELDNTSPPSSNNAASAVATREMANCFALYSTLQTEISYAYASDYMPFENNGEIITGLYEKNESPYPHTPYDTLENMDPEYVYEVTKGALGSALHFAVAREDLSTHDYNSSKALKIYPNPSHGKFTISLGTTADKNTHLTIFDILGKEVFSATLMEKTISIDLHFLQSGVYNAVFEQEKESINKKIILK